MKIDIIRQLIKDGKVKWATHCLEKLGERDISISDVKKCIVIGEIIEDYPDDYPHPSCLIYGLISRNKVLHTVVGSDGETAYIITAYYPNTVKFKSDLKTRRK